MYQMRRIFKSFASQLYKQKKRIHKISSDCVRLSEEVQENILNHGPIVALESTVITHGLPYPQNLSTALDLEKIVRENNAVPATIAILNGIIHVGLSAEQLELLATPKETSVKVSRRDMPYMISKGLSGGTTVAATMLIAHRVGIPIFATGGIGGVHRGAETSMDISADLYELSRTPISVISAGVKSILNIGLTLEYLESLGVCVATFGRSRDFPAFFTPSSGFFSPCHVETYAGAAHLIDCRDKLSLESGLLLAAAIPEAYKAEGLKTDQVISEAVRKSIEDEVKGKEVTPYILQKVQELSGGASLQANIGLLKNNAKIGSRIACELNKLKKQQPSMSFVRKASTHAASVSRPVVIGGSILDITVRLCEDIKMDGRTVRGRVQSAPGGVGRNLADCLSRLDANPLFLSVMGAQEYETLFEKMKHMDLTGVHVVPSARTATGVVLLDAEGECLSVVCDMDVHDHLLPELVEKHRESLVTAPLVVLDGNIPFRTMEYIFDICSKHQVPVWLEPTDVSLASRPFQQSSKWRSAISYASPNFNELKVMHSAILGREMALNPGSSLSTILETSLS